MPYWTVGFSPQGHRILDPRIPGRNGMGSDVCKAKLTGRCGPGLWVEGETCGFREASMPLPGWGRFDIGSVRVEKGKEESTL